jgi:hypothetical protein
MMSREAAMKKIIGTEGMSREQIRAELLRGGKFVVFQYCVSLIVVTFKRASDVYLVRPGDGMLGRSLPFSLISLVLGWWGLPWGPIWTIATITSNCRGGRDVTPEVIASFHPEVAPAPLPVRPAA